jgi:uncharacterized membrane protein
MTDPIPAQGKSSTGLDANVAAALTYLVGFITGVVFLAVEKDNRFVRFHAWQSTMVFGALFLIQVVLTITVVGWVLMAPLFLVQLVIWVLCMIKAFQGEMFKLPVIGEMAEKQLDK